MDIYWEIETFLGMPQLSLYFMRQQVKEKRWPDA